MPITPLSISQRKQQLETFIDFFVKEFMSEIWYLEESTRGNLAKRAEPSMAMLFNVACALVSLVPVPGAVIAFVASQKVTAHSYQPLGV